VRKMLLNMYVIADIPTSGNFLRISPVIRSYPGALVVCKRLIAALTSVALNFLIGGVGSLLVSRACSVSRLSPPVWSGVCG
jgi:hypothetical protein